MVSLTIPLRISKPTDTHTFDVMASFDVASNLWQALPRWLQCPAT